MQASQPRIFVNIASYRDSELPRTIEDLFEKAKHPERVFAGVCLQHVPGEDDDIALGKAWLDQCRTVEFHAKDALGVCWARHQTQKLWRGEEYIFQIDSHMRFKPDWDALLLEMLDECDSPRPVLSTYPVPYEPPEKLSPDALPVIYMKFFDKADIPAMDSTTIKPEDAPGKPEPSAFCAAGMLFGDSRIIEDVPYDPHLYFTGEEIILAVRLWTHGWDIFTPNRVVAYHDYTRREGRRRHWDDMTDWVKLSDISRTRVHYLLGMEKDGAPEALKDIDRYGLGDKRALSEYEAFSGVDFKRRLIKGKPGRVDDLPPDHKERRNMRKGMFVTIKQTNAWGCDETVSGAGSTLAETRIIRERLPEILAVLDAKTLADAGCGDVNWIGQITANLRRYHGFDIVEELVDEAKVKFADRRNHSFSHLDIVTGVLGEFDVIFCRDCLTHLDHGETLMALKRFKESGSRHLVSTTYVTGSNAKIKTGGWFPIDLSAPPFGLPKPRLILNESLSNPAKTLGVWSLAEIP